MSKKKLDYKMRDVLYPRVKVKMNDRSIKEMTMYISSYISKNSKALQTNGPIYKMYLTHRDKDKLYSIIGLNPKEITDVLLTSSNYNKGWDVSFNPFNNACTLYIKYLMDKGEKYRREMNMAIMFLALHLYVSVQYKYFKYEGKQEIMDYTINTLKKPGNYLISSEGNMQGVIKKTALGGFLNAEPKLKKDFSDKECVDFINSIKSRLNFVVQKLARVYYHNAENKMYMNLESDSFDDDNYHIANSDVFALESTTDKVVHTFITHSTNLRAVKTAADMCNVSYQELLKTIYLLSDDSDELPNIKRIVGIILEMFIMKGNHDAGLIRSQVFVTQSMKLYKQSNSNDPAIIEMREILNRWLENGSKTYRNTTREATLSNYKKALFVFFVFTIQANV